MILYLAYALSIVNVTDDDPESEKMGDVQILGIFRTFQEAEAAADDADDNYEVCVEQVELK